MKHIILLPLFFIMTAAFTLINPVSAQSETIYVFANLNVADRVLTQPDLQKIYLGKKNKWIDNQGINFTALSNGTCLETFIKKFVKKSPFQFQNYWKKQIFTGKGRPPLEFETDADLIDYVSRTSGAIGYSCTQPDITMVKILSIK